MKRIYLQKIHQHGEICYVGKIDPRELVRVATKVEMGEVQSAQRPLNKKRVQDIAKYVYDENGILPNTLTLATNDGSFEIFQLLDTDFYYINFPSEKDEFDLYYDKIDVMDGQHRLYSFLSDICLLHDDTQYEIGFTLYDKPTLLQRQKIFISCNEKQEKVNGNLLMWFKAKLNMLSEEEKNFFGVVQQLNESHPLKGKIIMSAETIKGGVKAKEVMAALKQAKIHYLYINGKELDDDQKVKIITTYLSAWEKFGGFKFATSKPKDVGPAIKMSGIKFMLLLLPSIWERAVATKNRFEEGFIVEVLGQLASELVVERERFFVSETTNYRFRERTGIDEFANQCISIIKSLGTKEFNPLG